MNMDLMIPLHQVENPRKQVHLIRGKQGLQS